MKPTLALHEQTALELTRRIRSREVCAREVTRAFLDAIAARDPSVHAYLMVDGDDTAAVGNTLCDADWTDVDT